MHPFRLTLGVCLVANLALAADHLEPVEKLSVRADGALHWRSRDSALSLPADGARILGGALTVIGATQTATSTLPSSGWSLNQRGTRLRYATVATESGPKFRVVLRTAKRLSVRSRGPVLALAEPRQQQIVLMLEIGEDRYCASCGAPMVDDSRRFEARDCASPAACPETTVTTTTTTPPGTGSTTMGEPTTSTTTTTLCSTLMTWGEFGTGEGQFYNPYGIAVAPDSSAVYTVELGSNRVQKFDAYGNFVAQWGTPGTGNGQFDNARDIAVGPGGNVYVVDQLNHRVQMFDANGAFLTAWGGPGADDGQFDAPNGIGVDGAGNVYVADTENERIQKFAPDGTFLAKWGTRPDLNGGSFTYPPYDVAADATRWVYVTDLWGNRLQRFDPNGTLVDVPLTSLLDFEPLAIDGGGRVYYGRGRVFRWDPATTTGPIAAWSGAVITGIAPADNGVVYVSEYGYSRIVKLFCP